ncbi:MAG: TonB family protein [Bryobacteraceae bacterium]
MLLLLIPALLLAQADKPWQEPCRQAREAITAGHYDEAEKILETYAAGAGALAHRAAPLLRDVARGYEKEVRYAEAERVYRSVLALWEAAAPGQPVVAASLNDLAAVLRGRRRHAEAVPPAERAAAILGAVAGQDSPAFGMALDKLGETLAAAGRQAEAAAAYQRALGVLNASLGPQNMMSAGVLGRYATVLSTLGQNEEARRSRERAEEIRAAKSARAASVTMPSLIEKVEPRYSEEARAAGLQGSIVVYAEIDTDGRASRAYVMTPLGMGLDEAAIAAVKSWRFRPAYRDGTPATVAATIEVNFRLM